MVEGSQGIDNPHEFLLGLSSLVADEVKALHARVKALEDELLDRLEWIHDVEHGHLGRNLETCRADLCRHPLELLLAGRRVTDEP